MVIMILVVFGDRNMADGSAVDPVDTLRSQDAIDVIAQGLVLEYWPSQIRGAGMA